MRTIDNPGAIQRFRVFLRRAREEKGTGPEPENIAPGARLTYSSVFVFVVFVFVFLIVCLTCCCVCFRVQVRGLNRNAYAFLVGTKYDLYTSMPPEEQRDIDKQVSSVVI